MKKKTVKKATKKQPITAILEGGCGFTKRMKLEEIVLVISVPFAYRLRISNPVLSDRFDVEPVVHGEFRLYRRTMKTAWYRLENVVQVRNIKQ